MKSKVKVVIQSSNLSWWVGIVKYREVLEHKIFERKLIEEAAKHALSLARQHKSEIEYGNLSKWDIRLFRACVEGDYEQFKEQELKRRRWFQGNI